MRSAYLLFFIFLLAGCTPTQTGITRAEFDEYKASQTAQAQTLTADLTLLRNTMNGTNLFLNEFIKIDPQAKQALETFKKERDKARAVTTQPPDAPTEGASKGGTQSPAHPAIPPTK